MCGRYIIQTEEENFEMRKIINQINERFKENSVQMKTGEIFPTNIVPIITSDFNNNKTPCLSKWGFPKFNQKSGVIINARSETLEEKPTFKKLVHQGRCLVPASGFFEWKPLANKKEKHIIKTSKQNFFYMAGLCKSVIDKDGSSFLNFVIITTEANKEMSKIHNRMPVILDLSEVDSWINSNIGFNKLKGVLCPYKGLLDIEKAS